MLSKKNTIVFSIVTLTVLSMLYLKTKEPIKLKSLFLRFYSKITFIFFLLTDVQLFDCFLIITYFQIISHQNLLNTAGDMMVTDTEMYF